MAGLFLAITSTLIAQKTIYGVVTDSLGNRIHGAVVTTCNATDIVKTNHLGEYEMVVSNQCQTLLFEYDSVEQSERISERTVINATLPIALASKKLLSMNPRIDYPLGLQLTLAGHSLFAASMNYFFNEKQSFEFGVCGRGPYLGTRRFFPLQSDGNNKALYMGMLFNLPLDSGFVLYVPFGYHIMSHNGMAFSIELAAKTPDTLDDNLSVINFMGFGINFGFQF